MIDFHNHVVHCIDDGPNNISQSFEMLKKAQKDGISRIINTVHIDSPRITINATKKDIINNTNQLNQLCENSNLDINIIPKAEVHFSEKILDYTNEELYVLGGKYMLIEFENMYLPKNYESILFQLQTKGIIPIIAHPERYRSIQNNINLLKKWCENGYIVQITAGSILGQLGKKAYECALKILQTGNCHLIGSDAHNNAKRNFCLQDAYSKVSSDFGEENVMIFTKNCEKILRGEKVRKMTIKKSKKLFSYKTILRLISSR